MAIAGQYLAENPTDIDKIGLSIFRARYESAKTNANKINLAGVASSQRHGMYVAEGLGSVVWSLRP